MDSKTMEILGHCKFCINRTGKPDIYMYLPSNSHNKEIFNVRTGINSEHFVLIRDK